jgi:Dolichyl-phosphate-mannose-protein mannosyltransferase
MSMCVVAIVCLAALAVGLSWRASTAPIRWSPDSLFYAAQAREVAGVPAERARHEVFFGRLGQSVAGSTGRVMDQRWVDRSSTFYRRRWVVPAMAAALGPVFGDRSLEVVSLLGYVLSGIALFFLVRMRFSPRIALAAASLSLLFPPFRQWSQYPLTDTMGVFCLALCMWCGWRALSESSWLNVVAWSGSVLLVSFTRDAAPIVVCAAVLFALSERSQRSLAVAVVGLASAIPAPLFFGAPLRETMAFTFSGNNLPTNASWHQVLAAYWPHVEGMLFRDFHLRDALPVTVALLGALLLLALRTASAQATQARRVAILAALGLAIAALPANSALDQTGLFTHITNGASLGFGTLLVLALVPLFLPARRDDAFLRFIRYGAIGAAAYMFLLPEYTGLRLALVLVPFATVGAARAIAMWPTPELTLDRKEALPARSV